MILGKNSLDDAKNNDLKIVIINRSVNPVRI